MNSGNGPVCVRCDELQAHVQLIPGALGTPGSWCCPSCGTTWMVARAGAIRTPPAICHSTLVWRLHGPGGEAASCWMRQVQDGWFLLTMYECGAVSLFERHRSDSELLARCANIWHMMSDQGWMEVVH